MVLQALNKAPFEPFSLAEPSVFTCQTVFFTILGEGGVAQFLYLKGLFLLFSGCLSYLSVRSYFPGLSQLPSEGSSCFDFSLVQDD